MEPMTLKQEREVSGVGNRISDRYLEKLGMQVGKRTHGQLAGSGGGWRLQQESE